MLFNYTQGIDRSPDYIKGLYLRELRQSCGKEAIAVERMLRYQYDANDLLILCDEYCVSKTAYIKAVNSYAKKLEYAKNAYMPELPVSSYSQKRFYHKWLSKIPLQGVWKAIFKLP